MIEKFNNEVPVAETGFGLPITHYVSGRISASVAEHGGLCDIRYNGAQHHTKNLIFKASATSSFGKLLRLQVLIDGEAYYLEFNNTGHYPFGFKSECCLKNVKIQHELVLDQDTLFQRIKVLDNPENCEVRARLLLHGHLWADAAGRTHEKWCIDPDTGQMSAIVNDTHPGVATNNVQIGANVRCNSYSRHEPFKYYMETETLADELYFYLTFNSEKDSVFGSQRIDGVFARYEKMIEDGPLFETGNPILDSALMNVAPTVAYLEIRDCPGALRASQSYWIWGWDSMVHAEALLWCGHFKVVRNMLDFYRETADPEKGIAHAFNADLSYMQECWMADNAQMLYAAMLHNYYAVTGDLATVERNIEFARLILARASKATSKYGNLAVGFGFFPDDYEALGHNKRDLSLINNSLFYQGLKCLGELEQELGNKETASKCFETAAKVKAGLETILWDNEKKYWLDSVAADDCSPRKHYPLYGQLLVSPFGAEPHAENSAEIADFMRSNFLFESGLYMFAKSDDAFMLDGNQLGAYYPPVDRYYWNIMNRVGDADAAEDFERIVTKFWQQHTYPEGLTHETVNADPTFDEPGGKQAFSAKAWLCDALELNLGLRVDLQGISLNPLPCERSFKVSNLVLRDKKINISRLGNGKSCQIILNGKTLANGPIRWDMLLSENTIDVKLCNP